jgi:hypothetical protein
MAAMLVFQTRESNYNSFELEHQHGGCDVMCIVQTLYIIHIMHILNFFLFIYRDVGFRLNVTVLHVKNISSKIECILQCAQDRCCRSVNYKEISSNNPSRICELLHEIVLNKSSLLQKNVLYDHVHIIEPHKVSVTININS